MDNPPGETEVGGWVGGWMGGRGRGDEVLSGTDTMDWRPER